MLTDAAVGDGLESRLRRACAELDRRLRAGESCRAEEFLDGVTADGPGDELGLELVYTEFATRQALGQHPCPSEWYRRFPAWEARLRRLFQIHDLLCDGQEGGARRAPGLAAEDGESGAPVEGLVPRPYILLEEVGRGGMGVVYKARQRQLGRVVALKMILAGAYAGAKERERFRAEAAAAAELQHPGIVQVFEVGEEDGIPYLVLEFVDGGSLAQRLDGTPWRPREAAALVEALAAAIHEAHLKGVVHRDLKPANVLLTPEGVAKITDFGLATRMGTGAAQALTSGVVGTPSYMAPEQAAGQGREVGPATDVYALGAMLYELLTGRPPHRGQSPLDTLQQVQCEEPVSPSSLVPGVPRDLETICLKCLTKEPSRRYASARGLAEDLRSYLDGRPILARRTPFWERAYKWARRRPAMAALLGLLMTSAAALVGGGLWYNAQLARSNAELHSALRREWRLAEEAARQRALAEDRAWLGRRHLYAAALRTAVGEWEAGHRELAQEIIESQRPGPGHRDARGFAWRYLWREYNRESSLLLAHRASVHVLALSPDGRRMASGSVDGDVVLWDLAGGRVLNVLREGAIPIGRLAFSPDGATLAASGGEWARPDSPGEVALWEVATGHLLAQASGSAHLGDGLAFSADGSSLLTVGGARPEEREVEIRDPHDLAIKGRVPGVACVAFAPGAARFATADMQGNVTIREASNGRARRALAGTGSAVVGLALAPGREKVALATADCALWLWDPADGQRVELGRGDGVAEELVFSPDGRMMAAGRGATIKVWDTTTRRECAEVAGDPGRLRALALSPDGRKLAVSRERTSALWDLAGDRPVWVAAPEAGLAHTFAFTPDGRELILGREDPRIWVSHLDTRDEPPAPRGHDDELWSLAFSPDGRALASGSDDETIKLWDTRTWRETASWRAHDGTVSSLAYSPDGNALASAGLDGTVKLWDPAGFRERARLLGHTDRVRSVVFSPDGRTLATAGSDRRILLWDPATGRRRATLVGHSDVIRALAVSPDGRTLASASNDKTIRLWDLPSGRLMRTLDGLDHVSCVAFGLDGRTLVSGDERGIVTIWDLADGTPAHRLRGHAGEVRAVAFCPGGLTLASAGRDRTVRIWCPETGQALLTLRGHAHWVNAVAFSPRGDVLVSGSHDGGLLLWRGPSDD
jgi:WD40 repeat protein/tRNA A-37 threonylcarbamoyl transferase component Bud32